MTNRMNTCEMCGAEVRSGQQLWHEAWHDQIRWKLDEMSDTVSNHSQLLSILNSIVMDGQ